MALSRSAESRKVLRKILGCVNSVSFTMASKESPAESSLSSQNSPQKLKSVPPSPSASKELANAVQQYGIHCASSEDLKTQLKNRPSLSPEQIDKLTNHQIFHEEAAKNIGEKLGKVRKTLFQEGSPQEGSPQKGSPQKY